MARSLFAARSGWLSAACVLVALSCGDSSTSNGPVVSKLEVSPLRLDLSIGETKGVTARALDAGGNTVSRKLFWSTSNASVATVTQNGVVTSVAAGTAEVAVSSGGASLRIPVVVSAREASLVRLAPAASTIMVGASTSLQVTVLDASGAVVEGSTVTWTTANSAIVSVGATGVVTGIAAGSATVTATVTTGTGGSIGGSAVVQVLPVPVASVSVSPTTSAMLAGQSLQLIAQTLDSAGAPLTARAVAWSTSAPAVANVSSTGLVIALAPGSATITAHSEGRSSIARVTVSAVPVAAVTIIPDSATVSVHQTAQLIARVTDSTGSLLDARLLTWSSDTPSAVTVDGNGVVTAVATGQARVTATAEGKSGSAVVIVTPIPVASIEVTPTSGALVQGDTLLLSARLLDAQGRVLTGRVVSWISGAPMIASVDSRGHVTAIGPGTALIIASSEGVRTTISITVAAATVAAVVTSPANATIQEGTTVQLSASIMDARGRPMAGKVATWISSNLSVATVSSTGLVQAIAPGSAGISARSDGIIGSSTITVVLVPIANVALTPPTAAVTTGRTVQLTVVLTDAAGRSLPLNGRLITWSSNAPSIATVGATGVVTGTSAGSATVRADVDGKTGISSIVVSDAPVSSVSVSPGTTQLTAGSSAQFTATALDAGGLVLTGRSVSWSSSDPGVASVSSSGLVSALSPGTVQLTATIGGVAGSATVTVAAVSVASVAVTPGSASIVVGGTVQLAAAASDVAGNILLGRAVSWSSATPAVATIDANGLVSAVGAGTSLVTATIDGVSASATITVTSVAVASVSVTPTTASLAVGGSVQLTATAKDAAGNVLTGRPTTWSTGALSVATVNGSGLVSAVSAGSAVISVSIGGVTASATMTVTAVPVASVSVTPGSASIAAGGTLQLTATAKDAAGNVLIGRTTSWSSGAPAVASINGSGLVSAVSAGSSVISVTIDGVTAAATITVTNAPVISASVSPTSTNLTVGGTVQLTVTARDGTGSIVTGRPTVWSSGSPSVATINANGLVTAVGVGSALLTVTVEGARGTSNVNVTEVPIANISVSPNTPSITAGASITLAATPTDAKGNVLSGRVLNWSSSNTAVATVSQTGSVSGVAAGSATITVSGASAGQSPPVSQSVKLSVTAPAVQGPARIVLAPISGTVHVGSLYARQVSAQVFDASGALMPNETVTWTTSDPTRLVVLPRNPTTAAAVGAAGSPAAGLLLIARAGSVTPVADTLTITTDLVPITRVVASPLLITITHKATQQLSVAALDSAGNQVGTANGNPLGGRAPAWKSADTKLVTVDSSGLATGGPQRGITRIEVYVDGVGPGIVAVIVP
ncbi:MAG: Ig-like domain-containing protein [Gemmatimonadota bacterium]